MKDIIADKFAEISKYKNIDKISVTALAKACNISRQAFYYHFRDIPDVATWRVQKQLDAALEQSCRETTDEGAIRVMVGFFSTSRETIRRQLESPMYRQFEVIFQSAIRKLLINIAERRQSQVSHVNFEAALDFCTGGVYVMMLTHAGESEKKDMWLVRQLDKLVTGELSLIEE
jgi:AcrR family transcriptional regulator